MHSISEKKYIYSTARRKIDFALPKWTEHGSIYTLGVGAISELVMAAETWIGRWWGRFKICLWNQKRSFCDAATKQTLHTFLKCSLLSRFSFLLWNSYATFHGEIPFSFSPHRYIIVYLDNKTLFDLMKNEGKIFAGVYAGYLSWSERRIRVYVYSSSHELVAK